MMNKIIQEALESGITFTIQFNKTTGKTEYIADGFYKSGTITLTEEDNVLVAKARYDERCEITDLRDLVMLNFKWWERSKERYEGWKAPANQWLPLLIKEKLIKEKSELIKTYTAN